jgi:uncharacterized protein YutE (UPF0331/DUF86 family)
MVDRVVFASKLAAIRDAVARIREVLPETPSKLAADRTAREVVTLNLFLALQEAISLATHWLADEGWEVPQSYGDVFTALAKRDVIPVDLAARLRSAVGVRNLIAHRYAALDVERLHSFAASDLDDLTRFCATLAGRLES